LQEELAHCCTAEGAEARLKVTLVDGLLLAHFLVLKLKIPAPPCITPAEICWNHPAQRWMYLATRGSLVIGQAGKLPVSLLKWLHLIG
jgi:hypothetical protein